MEEVDELIKRYDFQAKVLDNLVECKANKGEACFVLQVVDELDDPSTSSEDLKLARKYILKLKKLKIKGFAMGFPELTLEAIEREINEKAKGTN